MSELAGARPTGCGGVGPTPAFHQRTLTVSTAWYTVVGVMVGALETRGGVGAEMVTGRNVSAPTSALPGGATAAGLGAPLARARTPPPPPGARCAQTKRHTNPHSIAKSSALSTSAKASRPMPRR